MSTTNDLQSPNSLVSQRRSRFLLLTCHVLQARCSVAQLQVEALQVGQSRNADNALSGDHLTTVHVQCGECAEPCTASQDNQHMQCGVCSMTDNLALCRSKQ